jgi:hypothetical protein
MTNLNFPFMPGDLVRFKAYEQDHGASEIKIVKQNRITLIKSGATKMIPPVMVVIETVRNEVQFNEADGSYQHSIYKVLCQWFSYERTEFQERWFDTRLLSKINDFESNKPLSKEDFPYGLCVILKTALLSNRQTSEEFTSAIGGGLLIDDQTNYTLVRTFDTLNYLPPKMLVTEIVDRVPTPVIYNKKNGEIRRKISKWTAKCMWYDHKTGKYSELHFAPEALIDCKELQLLELGAWDSIDPSEVS